VNNNTAKVYKNWLTGNVSKWCHTKMATNASKSVSTVKYLQFHDKSHSIFYISLSLSDTRT